MSPQLVDLPPEILLRIAEILIENERCEETEPILVETTKSPERQRFAAEAIRSFSYSCPQIYDVLSPLLFRDIALCNTIPSSRAVHYLSGSRQAIHVRSLYVTAAIDSSSAWVERQDIVSQSYEKGLSTFLPILNELKLFSGLRTVIIDFGLRVDLRPYPKYILADGRCNVYYYGAKETRDAMVNPSVAKRPNYLKPLMNDVFFALSQNDPGTPSNLVIRSCPLRSLSTFSTKFHEWLCGLDGFRFETYGRNLDQDFCITGQV